MLRFHPDRARQLMADPDADLEGVDIDDSSDSLHVEIEHAQDLGGITSDTGERLYVYAESLAEDRPRIAVERGALTLLGGAVDLAPEGETMEFRALAFLREAVDVANAELATLDRQTANAGCLSARELAAMRGDHLERLGWPTVGEDIREGDRAAVVLTRLDESDDIYPLVRSWVGS